MKKAGSKRSDVAGAKIGICIFRYNKYIPVKKMGYCDRLYQYGRVSCDAVGQIKDSLPEAVYKELEEILLEDDKQNAESASEG